MNFAPKEITFLSYKMTRRQGKEDKNKDNKKTRQRQRCWERFGDAFDYS